MSIDIVLADTRMLRKYKGRPYIRILKKTNELDLYFFYFYDGKGLQSSHSYQGSDMKNILATLQLSGIQIFDNENYRIKDFILDETMGATIYDVRNGYDFTLGCLRKDTELVLEVFGIKYRGIE